MLRSVLFSVLMIFMLEGYTQSLNENYYRVLAVSKVDSSLYAASNQVRAVTPLILKVPTAFSPNNDGLNDTFGVLSEGLEFFEMTIYNRWGEVVFFSDKIGARWDGDYKGKPSPLGAYGYKIIAKDANNRSIKKEGTVILVN